LGRGHGASLGVRRAGLGAPAARGVRGIGRPRGAAQERRCRPGVRRRRADIGRRRLLQPESLKAVQVIGVRVYRSSTIP
jgi:hypothetical protein